MDPRVLNFINTGFLLIFVILVILAVSRISLRYIEYKRQNLKVPALLPRDFFLFAGLGIPFIGVLFIRAAGIIASEQWWYPFWVIISGTFGIFGVANWVYVEYFKIEK